MRKQAGIELDTSSYVLTQTSHIVKGKLLPEAQFQCSFVALLATVTMELIGGRKISNTLKEMRNLVQKWSGDTDAKIGVKIPECNAAPV